MYIGLFVTRIRKCTWKPVGKLDEVRPRMPVGIYGCLKRLRVNIDSLVYAILVV